MYNRSCSRSIVSEIKSPEKVRYGQPLPNASDSVQVASNYKMHTERLKGIS
jgi:hypothetical protein